VQHEPEQTVQRGVAAEEARERVHRVLRRQGAARRALTVADTTSLIRTQNRAEVSEAPRTGRELETERP
jgi:hypothetical protein